jgi:hypothetical protein
MDDTILCLILLIVGLFFFPVLIVLVVLYWNKRKTNQTLNIMFWIAVILLALWLLGVVVGVLSGILRAIF